MVDAIDRTATADWSTGLPGVTPAGGVSAKLVVLSGEDEGRELPLVSKLTIGADPTSDLALRDRRVSRKHAELALRNGRVVLRDVGSRNGTLVGQSKIKEIELPLGAVIRVGDTLLGVHPRWYTRELSPSNARRFGELTGGSLRMREIYAVLERVAPSAVTVLIEGESGTGKELAARSIHAASGRRERPYVVFDCAAVPRELAESELFGHRRGAFSGAVSDRAGTFVQANGGTIFLDELGELPLELQPKLLRVLETGDVKAVGDDNMRHVDVRVIAATNRDLRAEVRRGRFREDLLYRLEVVKVRLPPLRERIEDIGDITRELFGDELAPGSEVAGENLQRLMAHAWPGNVRELRNVLERAMVMAAQPPRFDRLVFNLGPLTAQPAALGNAYPGVASPLPFKEAKEQLLDSFERAYLDALLERHKGNLTHAAQAAGISRKHLSELCKKYDVR
ncbi:MAG: sigma 54-interacting transcriptional regulator [Polyangiaceae bacterium]